MNPELPAHHVSPSMKIIMLVFAVALIATLGWFVWDNNKVSDSTDNTTPSLKKATTTATDETKDWKTYTDSANKISFKYPGEEEPIDNPTDNYPISTSFANFGLYNDSLSYTAENKAFKKVNINGLYMENGEGAKETTVAGEQAFYYSEGDAGLSQTVYAFPNKDKTKILRLYFTKDSEVSKKPLFIPALQTILSTVKYLD